VKEVIETARQITQKPITAIESPLDWTIDTNDDTTEKWDA
jgi:hypothetical protein